MTTETWISIAAIIAATVLSVANIVATIIGSRPRDEAFAIASFVLPQVINWTITALSIIGALLFLQSLHVAALLCWVAGAGIYSYFFLKAEGPPTRSGVFMLVVHFSMVTGMALLGLLSRTIDALQALVHALTR